MIPSPEQDTFSGFFIAARTPRRRSIECFAEQEIVLPTGPFGGRRFSCERQPFARHLLQQIDSGYWQRFLITGPSQSGKTLMGSVIPVMYHLFELQEPGGYAVPSLDMVKDKWRSDLLPVIERSRYRDLLPTEGGGARGGTPSRIEFKNGMQLRFFTAGGGDKALAGYTARWLVVTESDGFDKQAETSRESTKIKQLEARTNSYGGRARIYHECTVSTETGFIWQEYKQHSSGSRLALPCPHCREYVTPEREDFTGWEGASTILEAGKLGQIYCPSCKEGWSDADRIAANQASRLVHANQTIDREGNLTGDLPPTRTLGFRWTMANNLLWTQAKIAEAEWKASREIDEEAAELQMRQFYWTLPAVPQVHELSVLDAHKLNMRTASWPRGTVPSECVALTCGVDLGMRKGHWVLIAWLPGSIGQIVEYETFDVHSDEHGEDLAIYNALQLFHKRVQAGWTWQGHPHTVSPQQVWVDCGYKPPSVYAFVREAGEVYQATRGFGATEGRTARYNKPTKSGNEIRHIGEEYHFVLDKEAQIYRVDVNADHWKSVLNDGLSIPIADPPRPGTIRLFATASQREHATISKHFTAEKQFEEFVHGRGLVRRWERLKRANHYFDAAYLARAAAHFCNVELVERFDPPADPEPPSTSRPITTPDGRPFLVTER